MLGSLCFGKVGHFGEKLGEWCPVVHQMNPRFSPKERELTETNTRKIPATPTSFWLTGSYLDHWRPSTVPRGSLRKPWLVPQLRVDDFYLTQMSGRPKGFSADVSVLRAWNHTLDLHSSPSGAQSLLSWLHWTYLFSAHGPFFLLGRPQGNSRVSSLRKPPASR